MSDDGNGYLGIDVGGTTIKYGVCKGDGTIVSRQSIPTEALMDPEAVIRHGHKIQKQDHETSGRGPSCSRSFGHHELVLT